MVADPFGTMTVVVAVALGVTTLAVLLRCYVRVVLQRRFAADDYLIVFSQVNFCAFMYCVLQQVRYGMGRHLLELWMKDPKRLIIAIKYWWIAQTFYVFALCPVKVSVAIFFCSLQPPRILKRVAIGAACLSIINGLGTALFQIFSCAPVSYFWDRFNPPGPKGSCFDRHKSFAVLQTVNSLDALTDMVLALLPCIMVWNMALTRPKKVGVSVLLGIGSLSGIAAIVRAFYFKDMMYGNDVTYHAWHVTLTSVLEPAIAISVVCFAHIRPLLRQIFPKKWFSIDEAPSSSNIVTFGQLGRRPGRRTSETSLNSQLQLGTYSHTVDNFSNAHSDKDSTSKDLEQGIRIKVTAPSQTGRS